MMKKLLIIICILIQFLDLKAQDRCGIDSILIHQQQTDSTAFNERILQINEAIKNYIDYNNSLHAPLPVSSNATYIIPVVVHIISNPTDPIGAISYAQVESQIDALNKAFAMDYPGYNGQAHGAFARDTRIQFCLAQTPMGPSDWTVTTEPGVMRYSDAVRADHYKTVIGTNDLLDLTHPGLTSGSSNFFPFDNYLNIWVVQSIDGLCSGVQGYSLLPLSPAFGINSYLIDGVVMRADAFGDNSTGNTFTLQPHNFYGTTCPSATSQRNQGKVLVHEVGHYLSLFHTFQTDIFTGNNCSGASSTTCSTEGDFICDTPPSNITSPQLPSFDCSGFRNTCNETYAPYLINYSNPIINPNDQTENYMYYSFDACWNTFTEDQADRMEAYLSIFRSNLFSVQNQIASGIIGPTGCLPSTLFSNIYFTTTLPNNAVCINSNISFTTDEAPANTATTYNWSFPGGTPSTSILSNPSVTFAAPGQYTVTLTTSDGIINSTTNFNISVSACAPISDLSQANWYFGQYGSVDFLSGIPVANTTALTALSIFAREACVTQNDPNTGATIFYSNGIDIWNGQHQQFNVIPLGGNQSLATNTVIGSDLTNSAAQMISVPFPGNPNMYYLIIPPAVENSNLGLRFAVIDMNLFTSGFQGSVVSQGLLPNHSTNTAGTYAEAVTTIPHCNGIDYWIITHGIGTNRRFYVYLLSSIGLTNASLTSIIPDAYGIFNQTSGGNESVLKSSPDGTRLAFASYPNFTLADYLFDNSTGIISSENLLSTTGAERFYYCSYSPNSDFLYATSQNMQRIIQFELSSSAWNVVVNTNQYLYQLQLGPDGKLYVPRYDTDIAAIDFPDVLNTTAFTPIAIDFTSIPGSFPKLQLPNMIDAVKPAETTPNFTVTMINCSTATFTVDACWQNYSASWDFGDGSPIVTGNSVVHTFAATSTYNVTLTLSAPLLTTPFVITQPVSIINGTVSITGPTNTCLGGSPYSYSVPLINGATYTWTTSSNGTILGPSSGSQIDINWISGTSGTVNLTIDNGSGCIINTNINVTINVQPSITISSNQAYVCPAGSPVTLTANGASTYLWTYGSSTATGNPITDNPLADQTYTAIGTDLNGCQSSASITIPVLLVCPCTNCTDLTTTGILSSSPAAGLIYCVNNNITITGTVDIKFCELKISPNVTITVAPGATLNILGSHLYSCNDMWSGIVVQPGGTISVQPIVIVIPPLVVITRTPLIEDAFTAIEIQSGSTITSNLLTINKAVFNRNEYDIKISGYTPLLASYPFSITNSVFTCRDLPFNPNSLMWPQTANVKSTYTVSTPLRSPYINPANYSDINANAFLKAPFTPSSNKSNTAIYLSSVGNVVNPASTPTWYEIKIGNNGVPNFNIFDNHIFYIDAFNANFTSVNNVFQNTIGPKDGIAIRASAKELNYRAQVIPGTPNGNFNNKFFDCHTSIQTTNYFENTFRFCDVRSTQVSTAPVLPLANHKGVYGFNITTNRYRVLNMSDNKLYNIENAITFNANFGPYNIGGIYASSNGQYSGQVNVDRNEIAPHLPSYFISTEYVRSAISLSNVILSNFYGIASTKVNANNNKISNVHKGILAMNWSKKDVINTDNVITLVTDPFSATATQYGIVHFNNSAAVSFGNNIIGNTVTGTGIFTNANVLGIGSAVSTNLRVECNKVSATTYGFQFAGNNPITTFLDNSMTNHKYGYVLSNNGIIGLQGSPTNASDNRWFGTWASPNFKTATINSSAQNSKMYIRTTGVSAFNPDPSGINIGGTATVDEYLFSNIPPTLLFTSTSVPFSFCPIPFGGGGTPSPAIGLLEQIAQDAISFPNNDDETKYINKNQLYRLLKADPSLAASSIVLQDFYDTSDSTLRETFTSIEEDIAAGDLANGQNKTDALLPDNSIEDNYKTFFNAYLKHQTDTILPGDSLTILDMANACPFTDGDVVYQARALYNSIYYTNIYFENNCPEGEESRFHNVIYDENTSFDVLVYPNPSNGIFTMVPFDSNIKELEIKVMDVNGKIILEKTINSTDRLFNFNLDLSNGVYVLFINDNVNDNKVVKRIVIQK